MMSDAIAPMPAVPQRTPAAPANATRQAATDFEATAIGELLTPMFDTLGAPDANFGGGAAEQSWRPMLISEVARQIARAGGLGLAEPIYQQMLRLQEARK